MNVVVHALVSEAGAAAAGHLAESLAARVSPVLGIATGGSPQALYQALARLVVEGLDLRSVRSFALDEYVGLDPVTPQSYHRTIEQDVTMPLGLDPARVRVPDGMASDLAAAARRFELAIKGEGGIDVQILGIGRNGHIGFNEPGSPRDSRTRVVELSDTSRAANRRYFRPPQEVPTHAVTQGIATILEARELMLVANGTAKASVIRDALCGPVNTCLPASFLQHHPAVTVYLDRAAASLLPPSVVGVHA
jgi:glucosamine-6-phosphate deaminase